ncbi:MAG TPA: SO2930 family diheme c-type cytochrome [Saprospiraceae bacterium]|nr:SO2930 family diheme c-type cytochrome [Saprospiraceae bacterium]
MRLKLMGLVLLLVLLIEFCSSPTPLVQLPPPGVPFKLLSDYHLFKGEMASLHPNGSVLPYEVINSLFTDYALKARFVWMPEDSSASMLEDGSISFPDGTMLIKNFYYPADMRKVSEEIKILETRLLVREQGHWSAYAYIWNDEQNEAIYSPVGAILPVSWVDTAGNNQSIHYLVPNKNQCKNCHNQNESVQPIGPKYANLNRLVNQEDGSTINQIERWVNNGFLQKFSNTDSLATMPSWDDPASGDLQTRALAYLDVNCGHCHRPEGPGNTSGLYLQFTETNETHLGLCKVPVAAGKGSGGRTFDIKPGQPDQSILMYRIQSIDPGVMMPELGRTMVHEEGVAVVREWIASLQTNCYD